MFLLAAAVLLLGACAARRGATPVTAVTTTAPSPSTTATPVASSTSPVTATTEAWAPSAPPCAEPGGWGTCTLAAYPDRPYDVRVPSGDTTGAPVPVVVVIHGGGGSAENAETMTCPGGDRDEAGCLQGLGDREGFLTVFPNGSSFPPVRKLRTWNAGGGSDGWNCTSGRACKEHVDDMSYLDAVLDDLAARYHIDPGRVYAVGLSNGAALAHRLACERADRFAAIVAAAGSNQFSTTADCAPSAPVAVMQIHGTDDPCWTYETSDQACLDHGGDKLGAVESVTGWADRLGCGGSTDEDLPDVVDDGTATTVTNWSGCRGGVEVVLATVRGGGHTWPNGHPSLERRVGRVTRDWGNEVVWAFLRRFHREG